MRALPRVGIVKGGVERPEENHRPTKPRVELGREMSTQVFGAGNAGLN